MGFHHFPPTASHQFPPTSIPSVPTNQHPTSSDQSASHQFPPTGIPLVPTNQHPTSSYQPASHQFPPTSVPTSSHQPASPLVPTCQHPTSSHLPVPQFTQRPHEFSDALVVFVVRQRQNEVVPALEVHDAQPVSLVAHTYSRHLKLQSENLPFIPSSHSFERSSIVNTAFISQLEDFITKICLRWVCGVRVLTSVMGIPGRSYLHL